MAKFSTATGVFVASLAAASAGSPAIDPDIAEAIFRYQFDNNASGQHNSAHVYCLAYAAADSESDPPAELIARFSGNEPPVKPQSQCARDKKNSYVVIDSTTHQTGLIFSISVVKCSSATTCEAEGGYFEASESSSGNTYYLEKQNGKWVVTRDVMHWIS